MALFKRYSLSLLLLILNISLIIGEDDINNISFIDYSYLKNQEFQLNLGYQTDNIYFFSIDKFVSHNLIASTKLSIINLDDFEFLNQTTFQLSRKNSPLSLLFSYNYFFKHTEKYNWIDLGPIFEFTIKDRYLSAFGFYYSITNIDASDNSVNYIYNLKTILKNNCSLMIAFNYNSQSSIINKLIEINIEI